jgi:hypothetical protein
MWGIYSVRTTRRMPKCMLNFGQPRMAMFQTRDGHTRDVEHAVAPAQTKPNHGGAWGR